MLPDLRRLNDSCLLRVDGDEDICEGIVSGGRVFGETGGRVARDDVFDSGLFAEEALNVKLRCFQLWPGALADRS